MSEVDQLVTRELTEEELALDEIVEPEPEEAELDEEAVDPAPFVEPIARSLKRLAEEQG